VIRFWPQTKSRTWHTHLSRHQCADRLTGTRELICIGRSDDSFSLRRRKIWGYHNGFMPVFFGKLGDAPGGGTRIEGYFSVILFTRIAASIMYLMSAAMAIFAAIGAATDSEPGARLLATLTGLAVGIGTGIGTAGVLWLFFRFAWWIDSGDMQFIIKFFENSLEATEQPMEQVN